MAHWTQKLNELEKEYVIMLLENNSYYELMRKEYIMATTEQKAENHRTTGKKHTKRENPKVESHSVCFLFDFSRSQRSKYRFRRRFCA